MAVFGVRGSRDVGGYMMFVREGFKSFAAFALRGGVRYHGKGLWVVAVRPRFPEFYWLGLFMVAGSFLLGRWAWVAFVPGLLVLSVGVFWWGRLYAWLLQRGARRYYDDRGLVLEYVNLDELEVLLWGKGKF